jgi:hypothetical protein
VVHGVLVLERLFVQAAALGSLGRNAARDDERITDLMLELRADANWAFLKPRRTHLRDELHRRIRGHIERAEPDSLAGSVAKIETPASAPENQIPQWLFAFDPAARRLFGRWRSSPRTRTSSHAREPRSRMERPQRKLTAPCCGPRCWRRYVCGLRHR